MHVEGERRFDAEALHDGAAHAVGEAPLLVTKAPKDLPRAFDVAGSDPDKLGQSPAEQSLAE